MKTISPEKAVADFLRWSDSMYPGSAKKITAKINTSGLSGLNAALTFDSLSKYITGWPNALPNSPTSAAPGMTLQPNALPEAKSSPWYERMFTTVADAAATILPTYWNYQNSKDIADMQIERMRNGLEPIDSSLYFQPPPAIRTQHNVGVDQQTLTYLGLGALAIGALVMISR